MNKNKDVQSEVISTHCVNNEKGERDFWIFFFENAFGLLVSVLNERLRDIVSEQIRKFYKIYQLWPIFLFDVLIVDLQNVDLLFYDSSNIWFKKTGTIRSTVSLVRIVPVFLNQTLDVLKSKVEARWKILGLKINVSKNYWY